MFNAGSYTSVTEYLRRVEKVNVTEQGNYLEDELPEDYSGSLLVMEVVHELILVDSSGQMFQQLLSPPKSMDKDGDPSQGLSIDGSTVVDGATPTKLTTVFNEDIDDELRGRVEQMVALSVLLAETQ